MKVLVCPLDWGIGHATRCVPVIRKFMENGFEVVIAADGRPLQFLKKEFPGCRTIVLRGIRITYAKSGRLLLRMIWLLPLIYRGYLREHRDLKMMIRAENPDIIFSDNRYGLWSSDRFCIFMTHQLRIILPPGIRFISCMAERWIQSRIRKFNECWVPDFELHQGLAGLLSHPVHLPENAYYIGTLSRFSATPGERLSSLPWEYDIMVMLSGPEPQRTILEVMVFSQLENSGLSGVIVRGITEETEEFDLTEKIHVFPHLDTTRMKELLLKSHTLICRSGYSSLMDLATLGKNAILIPTPGQPEQEYLARFHMEKKIYFSMPQRHFDLLYAIEMSRNFHGLVMQNDYKILEERIREVTSRVTRDA